MRQKQYWISVQNLGEMDCLSRSNSASRSRWVFPICSSKGCRNILCNQPKRVRTWRHYTEYQALQFPFPRRWSPNIPYRWEEQRESPYQYCQGLPYCTSFRRQLSRFWQGFRCTHTRRTLQSSREKPKTVRFKVYHTTQYLLRRLGEYYLRRKTTLPERTQRSYPRYPQGKAH